MGPGEQEQQPRQLMMAEQRADSDTEWVKLLTVYLRVNGHPAIAMIDSGATVNFMMPRYAEINKIPTRRKKEPYRLAQVDGSTVSHNNR